VNCEDVRGGDSGNVTAIGDGGAGGDGGNCNATGGDATGGSGGHSTAIGGGGGAGALGCKLSSLEGRTTEVRPFFVTIGHWRVLGSDKELGGAEPPLVRKLRGAPATWE